MRVVKTLIADHDPSFREALGMFLMQQDDIRVIGEAGDQVQVSALVKAVKADILLLDIQLFAPERNNVINLLHTTHPETKVLLICDSYDFEFITECLVHGARGITLKTCPYGDLVKAIRAIDTGELWVGRHMLAYVLESLSAKWLHEPFLQKVQEQLTDRERQILKLVIRGMTNKEIAQQLGISDKTVKTHIKHIFNKLGLSRRLELLRFFIIIGPAQEQHQDQRYFQPLWLNR